MINKEMNSNSYIWQVKLNYLLFFRGATKASIWLTFNVLFLLNPIQIVSRIFDELVHFLSLLVQTLYILTNLCKLRLPILLHELFELLFFSQIIQQLHITCLLVSSQTLTACYLGNISVYIILHLIDAVISYWLLKVNRSKGIATTNI